MAIYTIPAGKHYSRPRRIRFYLFKNTWNWQCSFDSSCRYKPDTNDHTNKLVGVGFSLDPLRNSIRVGWRYNSYTDSISLWLYAHINGGTEMKYLCDVAFNKEFGVRLSLDRDTWTLWILGSGDLALGHSFVIGGRKWWGYGMQAYFGGNAVAPNDMKIGIR